MTDDAGKDFSSAVTVKTDTLPRWNFENFYPDVDSAEFKADFKKLENLIGNFTARYEGKLADLNGNDLAKAIQEDKEIETLFGKLYTYMQLKHTQDSVKYGSDMVAFENKARPLGSKTAFFSHEIKQVSEQNIQDFLKTSSKLMKFAPWLNDIRRAIPHTPSLDIQKYGGELSPASGWHKLFDDTHIAKKYSFEGKELGDEEISEIFSNDPDQARRAAAHQVFQDGMKESASLFTSIHNELMRLKSIDDRWEKFDQPWDARHFSNNVTPEIVNALEKAVKDSYPRISHRFYDLKAKLMGQKHLNIYDRNINIFAGEEKKYVPFLEAKEMVLNAYRSFSPQMADEAEKFFANGWIDAPVGKNKQGGAFAHPGGAYLAHPMVMLNYQGAPRDIETMAHELGHGVHQSLAAHKGDAIVETPITLAETASVFGEMLTFKSLLSNAENNDERRKLLFGKVNTMINTVFRQISFYDFEKRIHSTYKDKGGPLSEEEFGKHWVEALQESYGPAIPLDDDYGPVFGFLPHIVHTPFYVYGYAFGDALVNALYRVYEEGNVPDFEEKYIKMLEAGGTLKPEDLQDMFGLDITDPAFWNKGLQVIEDMLDELETLCDPLLEQKAQPPVPKKP